MRTKYYWTTLLLFLCAANTFGQAIPSVDQINTEISARLSSPHFTNLAKLKDSVALYAFAVELNVRRVKNKTVVDSIRTNDSIAQILYNDLDFLNDLNYSSVLEKRKKAIIIIPVGIMIAYTKQGTHIPPLVNAEDILTKILGMFNYHPKSRNRNTSDFLYLTPVMCLCSAKVYDRE